MIPEATKYAAVEKKLKQKFGDRFFGTEKSTPKVEIIPTGYPTIDRVLGGGLPVGRMIEIFGPESCGKSSLSMTFVKVFQELGHKSLLIDAEHAFNPEFAAAIGVDVNDLFIVEPMTAEESIDAACLVTADSSIKLVIIDSIASMVPEDEYKKDAEDNSVAPLARMLGRKIKQITAQCAENKIIFVAINQLRDTIQGGKITPGGGAIKYHASSRVEMKRAYPTWKIEKSGNQIGVITSLENKKCKIGKPYQKGNISIYFEGGQVGIDLIDDLINTAMETGVVAQAGSWFTFDGTRYQGKLALRAALIPLEKQLQAAIYETKSFLSNDNGSTPEGSPEEDGRSEIDP